MAHSRWCRLLVYLTMVGANGSSAFAQSTAQIPLQFDFLNPGARSLGLGSAFIAVADDATTAFTNPAGLTFLLRSEVSAELRYRRLSTPFLFGGRLSGTVTNLGADTIAGPIYSASIDSAVRPYFLSFVYPQRRWTLAAYRHELVLQSNSFLTAGTFEETTFLGSITNEARDIPLSGTREIKVDNYGDAFAYRLGGAVSAGVGIAIYHLNLQSDFVRLGVSHDSLFGPVDFNQRGSTATQHSDDTKVAINAGVVWTVDPKIRIGGVFRQGASFTFTQVDTIPFRPVLNREGSFRSPNVFGVGARWLPNDNWSFSFDYNRVQYSRLKEDFISFQAISTGAEAQLEISDGNEVHFGAEYVFAQAPLTPAVRGGVWYDPNHAVRFISDSSNSPLDVRMSATLPGGEDLWHYCAGLGLPLSKAFEFNVGADFSKQRRYVSASFVARLGK